MGSLIEVKIADFGLSALVRIGEDGYDVEESSKRKKYKGLTEMWEIGRASCRERVCYAV